MDKTIIFALPTNVIVQFVNQFFELKSFNFETESTCLVLLCQKQWVLLSPSPNQYTLLSTPCYFLHHLVCHILLLCLCLYCYNCHHLYHYHHLIIKCIETWAGNIFGFMVNHSFSNEGFIIIAFNLRSQALI